MARYFGAGLSPLSGSADLLGGDQGAQRGRQFVHLGQVDLRQPGDQLVASLGELNPGHPGVAGIRAAAHEAGRLGAVHETYRTMAPQQQVIGDLADRRRLGARMALDRDQELMLDLRQAGCDGLVFAPPLEAPQRDPECQQVLEVQPGWLIQGATSVTESRPSERTDITRSRSGWRP